MNINSQTTLKTESLSTHLVQYGADKKITLQECGEGQKLQFGPKTTGKVYTEYMEGESWKSKRADSVAQSANIYSDHTPSTT